MKHPSLRNRLLAYMQRHHTEWIPGATLERLVVARTDYKASNASRRLRELAEEGFLEERKVKGFVQYRFKDRSWIERQNKEALAYFDSYQPEPKTT